MKSKAEIKLHFPIQVDGKEVKTITMRRPTVRDRLLAFKGNNNPDDESIDVTMFSTLANIPEENIHDLDLLDFEQCQKAFGDFLKKPGSASGN